MARISNPVANNLKAEAEKILTDVQQLENSSDEAWKSGKWNDLTLKTGNFDSKVSQHLHKVRWNSLQNWSTDNAFGIALTHSVIKLRKDALFPCAILQ